MRTSRGRGPSACGPRPTASPRSTTSATERQENEPMIRALLTARALRAFADGFVAVLLPAYLLALGHGQLVVGVLSTATLFGSALATLAVGRWGHRFALRRLLLGTALLMVVTGLGFASLSSLWP